MKTIQIKSRSGNRVRLKWEIFKSRKNIQLINSKLDDLFIDFRVNRKCSSIIFRYKDNITLDLVLQKIQELFKDKVKTINLSAAASEAVCGSNSSCSRCELKQPDKKSWTRKLVEFGALSLYMGYLFVQEHILGAAVAASPLSLVAAVSLLAAIPLLKESYDDIKQKKFTLQTFMGGTLLLAILFGEATAAFEIIYILRGGMLLEEYIATKSKEQIHKLVELDVKKVYKIIDNVELEVDIDEISLGDLIVARSGEKIPVDGIIMDGSAEINEALINGRSEPGFKEKGDEVFAGTVCEKGRIYIEVQGVGNATYISRTMAEVERSLALKSPSELEADRLAARLLKLGTFLTVGTLVFTGSLVNAFAVMIVMSCPCATVLAASTAISGGIANGAKNGLLIKGGEALENISKADVFCFDKTGTLTTGKPLVTDIITLDFVKEDDLVKYAAMAEYRNTHPIARSIVQYAKDKNIFVEQNVLSQVIPGYGVTTSLDNDEILIGNRKLLERYEVAFEELETESLKFLDEGKTVVYIAKNKKLLGLLSFTHEVRAGTKQMIEDLKQKGVKHIVLLTGDEEKVADGFAKYYDFDAVYSNQTPHDKASVIEKLKNDYNKVVMVGDGVNDTFAMSKADVAVSFAAGGSEAAIAVSDIAVTHSHPEDVVYLYDLSKKSIQAVNQNYWIGTGTNLGGVVLAALGKLSPAAAGAIHIGHTVGIMANSSRLAYSS